MKRFYLLLIMATLCFANGMAQEKITSGGKQREMIVYAPKNLGENRPLLISMHGMNQDMGYQKGQANYEAVADTAKFVVVYPNGEGKSWDLGGMKDINFILDIIDAMATRYKIDRNRVYLSGFSMGGMMTYYAMTKIADKIAAFAPVSGYNMGGPNATSSRPIPIIHVHGTGDDVCTYSPVQSHIDAWVKRNKCKTTPITVKKGTSGEGTLYRYTDGLEGVEVAHLKLPGKGHWHSNDPVYGMSNIEIWNFCSRWSLLSGPTMQTISPENNSFDMSSDANRTFTVTLDKAAVCSKVKATLTKTGSKSITLTLAETDESKTLTFTVPEGTTLDDGTYKLKVTGLASSDGGKGSDIEAIYTYGIEEVGETMGVTTILTQDWLSQRDAIGEGIPDGWKRVNSNSDGGNDTRNQNEANTGGCRMKYFQPGGEIEAGFYLSAREYNNVDFTYGTYSGKTLTLNKGKYLLSFKSTYWTQGAADGANTFSVSILSNGNKNAIFTETSLKPEGCMADNADQQVTTCAHHELEFEVTTGGRYLLQFSYAAGWNGIILGEPTITTAPSTAEKYKGTFLRTLKKAKEMLAVLQNSDVTPSKLRKLQDAIEQYDSFFTISPSEYEKATAALNSAMKPLESEVDRLVKSEVTTFKKNNATILAKQESDITEDDLTAIDKALADYDALSDSAKAQLTAQKATLDALKIAAEADKAMDKTLKAEITKFKDDNATILAKQESSVTEDDLTAIDKALADYDALSDNAKDQLTTEKATLDSLKSAAELDKANKEAERALQAEISLFKTANADILAKQTSAVTEDDIAVIDKALADYDALSNNAKTQLAAEKATLDSLKSAAELDKANKEAERALQAEISKFKTDNATILAKQESSVTAADLAAIDKALADYDALSDNAKAQLAAEKAMLDSLKDIVVSINDIVRPTDTDIIYDLSGRRIVGTPKRGFYIVNGKKVKM